MMPQQWWRRLAARWHRLATCAEWPGARKRVLPIALAAVVAAPVLAATISVLRPPQQEMTEKIATAKGTLTLTYRPSARTRDLGCRPSRGTTRESYSYEVRDAKGRPAQWLAGIEIETPDQLWRIRDYYLKALPGARARAAGNGKVGKYVITRDQGDEAIVIEATRPTGKPSTIKMRRVIQAAPPAPSKASK